MASPADAQIANLRELVGRLQALAPTLSVSASPHQLDALALQAAMVRELGELIVSRASDAAGAMLEDEDDG